MAEYSGVKSRASCPAPCRYFVRAPETSASPPVLESGATSEAMRQTFSGMSSRILSGVEA